MYRLARWRCYLLMLMHEAGWLGWTLLLTLAALITAGFIWSPWTGVAAIGVGAFIAVMVMSFMIMVYGFNSITGVNMSMHSLKSEKNRVIIGFENGKELEVVKEDIRPYHIYPGGVIAPVEGKRRGWLWIPPKAFETDEEFKHFLKSIYGNESDSEQK